MFQSVVSYSQLPRACSGVATLYWVATCRHASLVNRQPLPALRCSPLLMQFCCSALLA